MSTRERTVVLTGAQKRALVAVSEHRCWKWTANDKWYSAGTSAIALEHLLAGGLIDLAPKRLRASWRDARLSDEGRALLEAL